MIHQTQSDAESDAALLARYASVRDEAAFDELMRRHGPMVQGVCTRVLRQPQDAEDAQQAVFLTLSDRARSLRRVRSVAGWLHNVAVRISLNVLKMKRRREQGLRKLQQDRSETEGDSENTNDSHELKELLDEELAQLPARFKEAVILRDLEGYSRSEVAKILGLPPGTVDSRLSRGRQQLRDRLVRRGVLVGTGGIAAALALGVNATAAVPVTLTLETIRIAEMFLAGARVVGSPEIAKITSLAQGELNRMFLTKLSTTVGIAALVVALVLGASPTSEMLGLRSVARATTIFLDDFEDGSITDKNPANWIVPSSIPNGQFRVENGDLILTPSDIPPTTPGYDTSVTEMDVVAEGVNVQDLSLRTRFRGLSPANANAPYWIGITARDTVTLDSNTGSFIFALIRSDGVMSFGYVLDNDVNGGGTLSEFGRAPTGLNFVAEDINLQLDVVGNQARMTAWGVSQPRPQAPQIRGTVPNSLAKSGTVVLSSFPQASDWNKPAAFRYVEVIAIPEPTSVTLGSLSALSLASLALRSRLVRVRR